MQIPDEILKCVAFAESQAADGWVLRGTVFFVSESLPPTDRSISWLVTAAHVYNRIKTESIDGRIWIRVNTKNGASRKIPTELSQWSVSPDKDVAVILWPIGPDFDHLYFPLAVEPIREGDLSLGDELAFIGLFSGRPGNARNVPIVRVGNIAAMPGEPLDLRYWGRMVAYLVEARSIGGLSGSPVFAVIGPVRVSEKGVRMGPRQLRLIGVMHGHFDADHRTVTDGSDAADADGAAREVVNMGISVVVPLGDVIETLNLPAFVKRRDDLRHEWQIRQAAVTPDADTGPNSANDT